MLVNASFAVLASRRLLWALALHNVWMLLTTSKQAMYSAFPAILIAMVALRILKIALDAILTLPISMLRLESAYAHLAKVHVSPVRP